NVLAFTNPTQGPIADLASGMKALGVIEAGFSEMLMWIANDVEFDALALPFYLKGFPNHVSDINNQYNSHAQAVIKNVYNPAISEISQGNPSFGTAPPVSIDPNNPSGSADGGGGDSGGGGDGGLGDLGNEFQNAINTLGNDF